MTNEPTTGEIVRAFRGAGVYGITTALELRIIDRLESQEAQIKQLAEALEYANEWHKESVENATNELRELSGIAGELEAMTARAESAERERDALISSIERLRTKKIELCSICEFEDLIACCHKDRCEGYQLFKRRGLQPQDGGEND